MARDINIHCCKSQMRNKLNWVRVVIPDFKFQPKQIVGIKADPNYNSQCLMPFCRVPGNSRAPSLHYAQVELSLTAKNWTENPSTIKFAVKRTKRETLQGEGATWRRHPSPAAACSLQKCGAMWCCAALRPLIFNERRLIYLVLI